jgi:hypothetical protein
MTRMLRQTNDFQTPTVMLLDTDTDGDVHMWLRSFMNREYTLRKRTQLEPTYYGPGAGRYGCLGRRCPCQLGKYYLNHTRLGVCHTY